jgi:Putative peptidoglycan binding domain
VLVKEAGKRLEQVQAVWETVTERVKVADASLQWKRGRAWLGQAKEVRPVQGFAVDAKGNAVGKVSADWTPSNNDSLDDDVMCLVEVPEQYETITKRVLKTPASVREVEVPAVYATVNRQVIDREASVNEVEIPATYQSLTTQVIDVEALRAKGYKFADNGDIVATPSGEPVLRASAVAGAKGAKSGGAASGEEGYVREVKVPAQYTTVKRRVIDQPASVREVEVASVNKTVMRRVVKTAATTTEVVVPAVYKTVTREVVDTPASSREVAVPAQYKTVTRQVVDTPPSAREVPVPAKTQVLTRREVDQPATTHEEKVPAVYKTVTRQIIDQPASTREIDVPAQYETLTRQVQVAEASTEWRSILCETNATPSKLKEIQRALVAAGYDPGPIDGVIRAQTMRAVNAYQAAKGLPVDAYLNLATVQSLGVNPN